MAYVAKRRSHCMRKIAFSILAIALIGFGVLQHNQSNKGNGHVKNIILVIGDGMGPAHIGLLESYARLAPNSIYQQQPSALQRLAEQGQTYLSLTSAYEALVVDSACSATQLATGVACRSEMVGLDIHGNPTKTLLELAKRKGKATGLVSDTRITHATPAAFAAHQAHRSMEAEIAQDLINNRVDVLLSGGLSFFLPQDSQQLSTELAQQIQHSGLSTTSRRQDNNNLLAQAQQQGYQLAFSANELQVSQQLPVLGLFQDSVMPDAIADKNPKRTYPSLLEMTNKALQLLQQEPNGFVLMVEAGQIDWAAHNNDTGGLLHEMLKFDEVLGSILNWAEQRNDTLIVVTADHETGGFGFSYHGTEQPNNYNFVHPQILDRLHQQSKGTYAILQEVLATQPQQAEQRLIDEVSQHLGITLSLEQAQEILHGSFAEYDDFYVYQTEKPLNKLAAIIAPELGIVWSTGTHTAMPVPVFVAGPSSVQQELKGVLTHTQLGQFLKQQL